MFVVIGKQDWRTDANVHNNAQKQGTVRMPITACEQPRNT